jgi:NitT/TauT family transport system substrate-binding protein
VIARRSVVPFLIALGLAAAARAQGTARGLEKPEVHIAVGGRNALYYLPMTIAERLGYFEAEGLRVKVSDFAGGSTALRAVVGGSADVVSGAYEHTISLQGKKQHFQAFVLQGRLPAVSLGVAKARAGSFRSFADLKGMKVGVSAPGSSTHNLVKQLLTRAGLAPSRDVAIIGVGVGASAIAALTSGRIDAISNVEPVMTKLEVEGAVTIVADTRTLAGTKAIWGAELPAASLYAPLDFVRKNPHTVQALANAIVRADKWIAKASAADVAGVVPESYLMGDRALYMTSFDKAKESFSPDGLVSEPGARAALAALRAFDEELHGDIDLARTYTNEFALKANARYR